MRNVVPHRQRVGALLHYNLPTEIKYRQGYIGWRAAECHEEHVKGVNCFTCSLRTCQKVSVMRADAARAATRGGGRKEKGAMFSLRSNISAVRREAPPGSGLTRIPEGRARHLGLIKPHLDIVHREFISEDAQSSNYPPPIPDQTPYENICSPREGGQSSSRWS